MMTNSEVPYAKDVEAVVDDKDDAQRIEARAYALRRSATALMFFSIVCSRPWPSVGWIGVIASFAVLCAPSSKIACRARLARFLSFVVAVGSAIACGHLVASINGGMPKRVGAELEAQCLTMPAATFEWGKRVLHEYCSQHNEDDVPNPSLLARPAALFPSHRVLLNQTVATLVGTDGLEQARLCSTFSHMVTCFGTMMLVASTIAHLGLFMSAASVIKRACCLRMTIYMQQYRINYGCGCKGPCTPADGANVAAKELA